MKANICISSSSAEEPVTDQPAVECKMKTEQEIRELLEADLHWIRTSYIEFMNGEMVLDCFNNRVRHADIRVAVYRDILGEPLPYHFETDRLHYKKSHGIEYPLK